MKWLMKQQVLRMHAKIMAETGGSNVLRDDSMLESALQAPLQTFGGKELYPTIVEKVVRLGYGLISKHPFIDGNKRIGTHVMLVLLSLKGIELTYDDDDLIQIILQVASGNVSEGRLLIWVKQHMA